ncbi:MAG TPA: malectin domain-containing carbohydrate-binding protein [Terriglobales bacterium]
MTPVLAAAADFREERAELHALIATGMFDRAPHLLNFLNYVCERSFQGQADQIKEYTIGVEALRRSPDFDPKKDSIVRVEAHRLRKRLEEYYAAEGATHRVRIVIPQGQYAPRFIVQEAPVKAVPENPLSVPPSLSPTENAPEKLVPVSVPNRSWMRGSWVAIVVLFCAIVSILLWRRVHNVAAGRSAAPVSVVAATVQPVSLTQPVPSEFRMLAGYSGQPITDQQGHLWAPDAYFSGGTASSISNDHWIEGAPESKLLQTQRSGEFRYDIPLTKGTHELRLHFVETEFGLGNRGAGGETARMFRIQINGVDAVPWLDPIAEAGGPNRLLVRVFKDVTQAPDGKLHLVFTAFYEPARQIVSPAILNALEILQSKPGFIHPIRIVTQDHPVTDVDGRTWSADAFYFGGMRAYRDEPVVNAHDKSLYRGERYGNFSYHIPLAPGKYRLKLHFAETWFGTPASHEPALGSRRFDVYANGASLLRNFEIAKEAGVNREIVKVFENLQPNAQGALWLEFVPLQNYAEVNAIEIEQTE